MNFKRVFLKNSLIAGGFTYLTQVIVFLGSIVTSRVLKPSDFGIVALITVFSGFISMFSDSTISFGVIRCSYRYTYHKGIHVVSILTGILMCILTLAILYPVSLFYKNTTIILPGTAIAILFIIKAFNVVPLAVLQKELRFAVAGRIVLIATLSGIICSILLAFGGFKFWSLIWSQYAVAIVTWLLLQRKSGYSLYTRKKKIIVKSFLLTRSVIGRMIGFNTVNYWARNADNLLVGKYYGTPDLGIYNRAYQMLMLPLALITGIFTSVLYPSLVRHKERGGDVENEYAFVLKLISFINLPLAIILILFPEQFVHLLWGDQWMKVAELLPYFGVLILTQTLFSTLGTVLMIEKHEKVLMYSGWVGAVCMVGGIVYGLFISLTAIAAFYALSYIVLVLPFNLIYVIHYKLKFRKLTRLLLPQIILSVLIWISIYYHRNDLLATALTLWVINIILNSLPELRKLVFLKRKSHLI
jgi:O-antigen/teichoic acid export membrane protein